MSRQTSNNTNKKGEDEAIKLTAKAVQTMVRGVEPEESLIVEIEKIIVSNDENGKQNNIIDISNSNHNNTTDNRIDNNCYVILYDGQDRVQAQIDGSCAAVMRNYTSITSNNKKMIIQINGFVASQANMYLQKDTDIILTITDFDVLQFITINVSNNHYNKDSATSTSSFFVLNQGRIQGGVFPKFLNKWTPCLSEYDLFGLTSNNKDNAEIYEQLKVVSDFLAKHHAMTTLHQNHNNNDDNNNNNLNHNDENNMLSVYMSVLNEYQLSQIDRQKASLTSNTGRENAITAQRIVQQHEMALQHAIQNYVNESLSVAKLNILHSIICDGLILDAGLIRSKNVKVGYTSFIHHEQVPASIKELIQTFQRLETRFIIQQKHNSNTNNNSNQNYNAVISIIIYATSIFMGILDLHPYSDGNGRLARICLNWALHKGGFPFVIQLFATQNQRLIHRDAVKQTRQYTNLISYGTATEDNLLYTYKHYGCLQPLTKFILNRLYKAVIEFNKLLDEKMSAHQEQIELRAAKRFRERAAQGTCLICFDSNPNIATLCCGKAVHLNCMAEWLSSNTSCPQCRANLPSIPQRIFTNNQNNQRTNALVDAILAAAEDNDTTTGDDVDDDHDSTTDDDDDDNTQDDDNNTTTTDTESNNNQQQQDNQVDNNATTDDDDDDDTTTDDTTEEDDANNNVPQPSNNNVMNDDTTTDDTTTASDDNNNNNNMDDDNDDTTTTNDNNDTEEDDDSTTTAVVMNNNSNNEILYCFNCNNRAARDCSNNACGRCCIVNGSHHCQRHTH